MKATHILLFLSPLLWFAPGILPMEDNQGSMLLDSFYKECWAGFRGA